MKEYENNLGTSENSVRLSYLQLNGLYLNSWAKPIRHTTQHDYALFSPAAVDATYKQRIYIYTSIYIYLHICRYRSRAPTN